MDPSTVTALLDAAERAKGILQTLFGPAAEQAGLMLGESVGAVRHKNLVDIVLKADQKLKDAGLPPQRVPLKIIHPLLEAASFESEPSLQEKWAALLASASAMQTEVPPFFSDILRQLSSADVRFLEAFARVPSEWRSIGLGRATQRGATGQLASNESIAARAFYDAGLCEDDRSTISEDGSVKIDSLDQYRYQLVLENLIRLGLIVRETSVSIRPSKYRYATKPLSGQDVQLQHVEEIRMTTLGRSFVHACAGPQKPKSRKRTERPRADR